MNNRDVIHQQFGTAERSDAGPAGGEADKEKDPVNLFPAEREARTPSWAMHHGWVKTGDQIKISIGRDARNLKSWRGARVGEPGKVKSPVDLLPGERESGMTRR